MPNTFDQITSDPSWVNKQKSLIASLRKQPLIIVIRIASSEIDEYHAQSLISIIGKLESNGIRHIEIAWSPHPRWILLVKEIKHTFANISLGVASISNKIGLNSITEIGFDYAMSPMWDPDLQRQARLHNQILIPGVFSPTEIQKAIVFGWRVVKIFPASNLGYNYINQLNGPISNMPFTIAAGGLKINDIDHWLKAGYGAVAIGRELFRNNEIDPLLAIWLKRNKPTP